MFQSPSRTLAVLALVCGVAAAQYNVAPAASPFTPLATDPLASLIGTITNSDDATEVVNLSFSFPWYQGPVSNIVVNSNGAVHFDGSLSPFLTLRNNTVGFPARIGVAQEDLNPASRGDIWMRDFGTSIVISWEDVPFFASTGAVNAQVELFSNGSMEVRFDAMTSGLASNNIHCGPAGPGLSVTAQSVIPEFNAQSQTSGGVLPQNTGVRFDPIPVAPEFQPNSPASDLTLAGQLVRSICPSDTTSLDANSTLIGLPYEILVNFSARRGLSNGGVATAGLQTFNVSLASTDLLFLNSLLGNGFFTLHPGSVSFTLIGGDPFVGCAQQLVFDPASADNYTLSAAVELTTNATTTSIFGTLTGDDATLTLQLAAGAPTCANLALPFCGTLLTQMTIDTNGRVIAGVAPSDFSPTLAEAQGVAVFGHWADFNQSAGGTINFTADATGLVVNWQGVPFFGDGPTGQNLSLSLDTSGVITIDVSGLVAPAVNASSAFLGLSSGNLAGGATDPGVTAFAAGAFGANILPTDMLYDFGPQNAALLPSVTALQLGLGTLVFTPGAVPGTYAWVGN